MLKPKILTLRFFFPVHVGNADNEIIELDLSFYRRLYRVPEESPDRKNRPGAVVNNLYVLYI